MVAERASGKTTQNKKLYSYGRGRNTRYVQHCIWRKGKNTWKGHFPDTEFTVPAWDWGSVRTSGDISLSHPLNTTHNKITVKHSRESWKTEMLSGEQCRGINQSKELIRYWDEPSDILSSIQNTQNQIRLT